MATSSSGTQASSQNSAAPPQEDPTARLSHSLANSSAKPEQLAILVPLIPHLFKLNQDNRLNRSGALGSLPGYFCQYLHTLLLAFKSAKAHVFAEICGDIIIIDFSTERPKISLISDKSGLIDDFDKSKTQLQAALQKVSENTDATEFWNEFEVELVHVYFPNSARVQTLREVADIMIGTRKLQLVRVTQSKQDLWKETVANAKVFGDRSNIRSPSGQIMSEIAIISSCLFTLTRRLADAIFDPVKLAADLSMSDTDLVQWITDIYSPEPASSSSPSPPISPPFKKHKQSDPPGLANFQEWFQEFALESAGTLDVDEIHDRFLDLIKRYSEEMQTLYHQVSQQSDSIAQLQNQMAIMQSELSRLSSLVADVTQNLQDLSNSDPIMKDKLAPTLDLLTAQAPPQ